MENIKQEKIVEVYSKKGIFITSEQAALILALLHKLATIFVSEYLKKVF